MCSWRLRVSYDLMVFDSKVAPTVREEFMDWFAQQVEWGEEHSYQDHNVTTDSLQAWFNEMIEYFPAMNGPLASDDVDDPKITDHCIGKSVIYSAFSWSESEEAFNKMRELAIKHSVGFFDVSSDNGEILFPENHTLPQNKKPWWKLW